jgi:hypothetical protein
LVENSMDDTSVIASLEESRRIEARLAQVTLASDSGWVARGKYMAFGVSWAVQSDDTSAFHMLLDRMPPSAAPTTSKAQSRTYAFRSLPATSSEPVASFALLADGRSLVRSSDVAEVADAFEEDLKWLVAERSPRRVFLRAGVVGWRDRAIVMPGGPRSGKSTLVRALVRCGATCFSDEYAVLEGNNVQPYPARLPIWPDEGKSLPSWADEAEEPGVPKPLPVGIVVFAPYQSGAVFRPKLLSRGKSLLAMFKHAVAAQRHPEQVLRALEAVSRKCNALEGARGDAHAVATFLLDRLV